MGNQSSCPEPAEVQTCPDMSLYTKTSDIQTCPDMSLYTKTSDIQTCPDISLYTKTSDIQIPDMSLYTKTSDIQTCPDMSLYTKTSDIQTCPEITSNVAVVKLDSGEKVFTRYEAANMCEFVNDEWVPTSYALNDCNTSSTANTCSHGYQVNCALSTATCKVYINPDLNNWGPSLNCGTHAPFCPQYPNGSEEITQIMYHKEIDAQ